MNDINLMPWRQALARHKKQIMLSEILFGLCLAVLCSGITRYVTLYCNTSMKEKIALLQQRLTMINTRLTNSPIVSTGTASITTKSIAQMLTKQQQLLFRLQHVALLLPRTANLSAITITNNHWRILGNTTNLAALWPYTAALGQQFHQFVGVKVNKERQQLQFTLSMHINDTSSTD
jgi:Tfp pilus assembly protein PilN